MKANPNSQSNVFWWCCATIVLFLSVGMPCCAENPPQTDQSPSSLSNTELPSPSGETLRVATFNVAMYRERAGELTQELKVSSDQATRLARVIQAARPDVLLLCEWDYEPTAAALNLFADQYLAVDQIGEKTALNYPHRLSIPSNTGVTSGLDLNADGKVRLPNDAWGFGRYPGQYAMAVLSRFPIDRGSIRMFQKLRWSQMPMALRPIDPRTDEPFHDDATWQKVRLSSKNHVDIPIRLAPNRTFHFLVSHPTPPVFDGPEDLNGRRNHDEIVFWKNYVDADQAATQWIIDDGGMPGGLSPEQPFVIAGDLNSDPNRGDSRREGIRALLKHPRVQDPKPVSETYQDATAQFGSGRQPRVDYVLPSSDWTVVASGVIWPAPGSPLADDVTASDHRLVYVDLQWPDGGDR